MLAGQLWLRILGVLQETLVAKCDFSILIDSGDLGVFNSLGLSLEGRINLKSVPHGCGRERVSCIGH